MKKYSLRLNTFTLEEFMSIKKILIDWNYDWLEYDLIHDNESEFVEVTFYLDEIVMSLSEFVHLFYDIGIESVYRGK